jgi:hypothetical protein
LLIVWILAGKATFYTGVALSALFPNGFFLEAAIFLIIFPLPVTIFAYIHYGLWGKADTNKPKWIASNASMHEATWQWFIAVVASIVAVIMLSLASVVTQGTLNPANLPNEKELNLYTFLVWGVVSTLMFRWKRLWAKKTEAKAKAKAEITAKQKQALKHIVALTPEEEMELLKQQINKKPPESGGE